MKQLLFILFLFFLFFSNASFGQDIRGGEIQYRFLGGFEYQIDVYLYTQTSMGISHAGDSTNLSNDITEWHYSFNHTYPGTGTYNIFEGDSFRIASIQNINNSSTEAITLSALLEINPNFSGNNSPVFGNKQTVVDVAGGYFIHNPMAYDMDDDSLSFSLVPTTSSNYSSPPGITIDAHSGVVQMPIAAGKYAINIQVDEWRKVGGTPHRIATTYREMMLDSNSVVGIKEIQQHSDFSFSPNPAHNKLNVECTLQNAELKIYDMMGRVVMEEKVHSPVSTFNFQLPGGVYFVRVSDGEKAVVQKLVVE